MHVQRTPHRKMKDDSRSTGLNFLVFSLLVVLTSPLECLPISETSASEDEQSAVFELENGLSDTKNVFLDPKVSEAILNQMEKILIKGKAGIEQQEIDFLAKCLVLFRNVLHISDNQFKEYVLMSNLPMLCPFNNHYMFQGRNHNRK